MDLPADISLRFGVHEASAPLALDALPHDERLQLEGFRHERRRHEFALGRATARALLAERLGVAAQDVPLRVAEDGAPELDGDLYVSIAHTRTRGQTRAAAVAASRPVGVDLEQVRPRRPDLYRFLLRPDDYDVLDQLPLDHDAAQVLIWTLKEATLKALRTGFRLSPKKLRLSVEPERQAATVRTEEGALWSLRYAERDGCFLAVAFSE